MEDRSMRRTLLSVAASVFVVLLVVEISTDPDPLDLLDVLMDAVQIALVVLVGVAVGAVAARQARLRGEQRALQRDLALARAEGEVWRRRADVQIKGLGTVIGHQLQSWGLSSAEQEIGRLMLKGFVHKEIAALRGTSEATVRHQARAIYAKAGVEGRAGFCAYFLEDLLAGADADRATLPAVAAAAAPPAPPDPPATPAAPASSRADAITHP